MITQFQGEDRKEAIQNHFSLELGEDEKFLFYIESMGYSVDASDDIIEALYDMFTNNKIK